MRFFLTFALVTTVSQAAVVPNTQADNIHRLAESSRIPTSPLGPFRSRPELAPAFVDVDVNKAERVHPGYVFVTPYALNTNATNQDPGSTIYDTQGNLVWTGSRTANVQQNLRPALNGSYVSYFSGAFGYGGWGYGHFRILDSSYRDIGGFGYSEPYLHDIHESHVYPDRSAVYSSYRFVPYDLSAKNGTANGNAIEGIATVANATTDTVLLHFNSLKYVPITDSVLNPTPNFPFDYFHINSILRDEKKNLLISARHTWSLYYIDGRYGSPIWTINSNPNGSLSNWDIDQDARFSYQHYVEWVDADHIKEKKSDSVRYISVFDNAGASANNNGPSGFHNYSRAIILKLQLYNSTFDDLEKSTYAPSHKIGRVSLLHEYKAKQPQTQSFSQGSAHVLDNGNVFVGWGSVGVFSEFTLDEELVFNAKFSEEGQQSYRAIKGPWTAVPYEAPAVIATSSKSNSTTSFWISWNGVTGPNVTYALSTGNSLKNLTQVTEIPKKGFETAYVLHELADFVLVQAKIDGIWKAQSSFEVIPLA